MGKTHLRAQCTNGVIEGIPAPPGFVSLTSFTLKKENEEETCDTNGFESAYEKGTAAIHVASSIVDATTLKSYLERRPWILYDQSNQNQEKSDSERLDMELAPKPLLPKGVIRGCPDCSDCVKVTARWDSENGRSELFQNAPVFHPTKEEFTDTIKYIKRIRPIAEPYGICRIVLPSSWQPPCPIKEDNIWRRARFGTKLQRIDGWQNQYSKNKVASSNETTSSKRRRKLETGLACRFDDGLVRNSDEAGLPDIADFDSESGLSFTLETFKKYADSFKDQYFCQRDKSTCKDDDSTFLPKPSLESIESEYRRIVENPTEEIEVLYGADIKAGAFGSGFTTVPNSEEMSGNQDYLKSGWNLNNTPRLPSSLLCFESCKTSRSLISRLHIGMCFSSIRWKVEDQHLYSLCYMHFGDPKVRYAIPGRYATQVDVVLKKRYPKLWVEEPGLRQKLLSQLSPFILKSEGIHVYRCVQHEGEFVLVFPGTYHSGFDCGFNCVESANYAPIDWLPYGQNAEELYRQQRMRTSISYDKLLLGAAREAVRAQWEISLARRVTSENLLWNDACGKDGILAKALNLRVTQESRRRKYLCSSLQSRKMDRNFDATCKRECCVCLADLHLSAVGCPCSIDVYSCLLHAKQLCSCAWSGKYLLSRYDINDLYVLVEAVEKKLSAVYRWAKEDLGLALNPNLAKQTWQQNVIGKEGGSKEAAIPTDRMDRDSFSSVKAEIKERLQQSTSTRATEKASLRTAAPSLIPDRIGIETATGVLRGEVVCGDSTSTSSPSDLEDSLGEKRGLVSACELNREDQDVASVYM